VTQEQIDDRNLDRPQPFQQTSRSRDILNQLTQGSLTRENVLPKPDVIFMGSSGNPPIVAGQTEPILPTGEPLEVPLPAEQIEWVENDIEQIQEDLNSGNVERTEINRRLDNLIQSDRDILNDINRYNPQILTGITIGTTLGLVLSGYFFPTYVDIDDDKEFIKADNIDYNPEIQKKKKEERDKRKKTYKTKQRPDLTSQKLVPNDGISIRKAPEIVRSFIPLKGNKNGTPLTYSQIQDYKSLLTTSELNKIKGKVLMFNESNKVVPKTGNKCLSVVGTNIINKIPVKI